MLYSIVIRDACITMHYSNMEESWKFSRHHGTCCYLLWIPLLCIIDAGFELCVTDICTNDIPLVVPMSGLMKDSAGKSIVLHGAKSFR